MKIDSSRAVMMPVKSLTIWKNIHKQCLRINSSLNMVDRSVKGIQTTLKKSTDGINRSLDRLEHAMKEINATLLEGFRRMPPKIDVSRNIVMEQSQQAAQSQQLAIRTLNPPKPPEAPKKVNWWKGLKEKKKEEKKREEKKEEQKAEKKPEKAPKPKINLSKDPAPVPPTPPVPPSPDKQSKIMNFLKTADVVKPFNAIKSFGEKAVKTAAKPEDIAVWNKMNENIDLTLGKIGEKALGALRPVMDTINQALTSGQLAPIIDAMANGFLFIANVISMVVDGLLWLVGIIQENWSFIKPILEAIAIVYLAAMIVQVYMLAAAWLAANWPILIVIAVIALLLWTLQKLGVSAADIVGGIMGFFAGLKVHIQNVIIAIQNQFLIFKDFLQNLFIDPVYAVKKLFYDLFVNFLDILYQMAVGAENFAGGFMKVIAGAINGMLKNFKKLTDALSKIPGFEKLANIRFNFVNPDNPHAVSELLLRAKNQITPPTSDKAVKNSEKIPYKEYTDPINDAVTKGRKFIDNFSDKGRSAKETGEEIKNALKVPNNADSSGVGIIANQTDNLNNVNRVNEVGAINDTVDISSDDLKMLRELAEIQAIQNFVELTPTVQVTTGNINNAGDIDSIITKIGQKLNEEFVSTAQGVYT